MLAQEEAAVGLPAVVLSGGLWRRQFGGDPSIVGSSVNLDGEAHTVVGVMPAEFDFPAGADLWLPISRVTEDMVPYERGTRWVAVIGRLAPNASFERARSEMSAITARLADEYPASNEGWDRSTVIELRDAIVGDVRPALFVALSAVAFVLLMVCANLANLLLARASTRGRELALRAALGASRIRLVRQLFAESVVLALLGGGFGVLLAAWGIDAIRTLTGSILPRVESVGIDVQVLGFALIVSLLTGVIFGMAPALRAARPSLQKALKEGGQGSLGERQRLRAALVVSQVALAAVLTISAGLMLKNFDQLRSVDPGFDPEGVLIARLSLTIPPERGSEEGFDYIHNPREEMTAALRALPGVEAVGAVNTLSLSTLGEPYPISREGASTSSEDTIRSDARFVNGEYFRAMGIPLLAGNVFPEPGRQDAPLRTVLSQAAAQRLWPGEDPVGRTVQVFGNDVEVIGVVADVRYAGLTEEPPPTVYLQHYENPRVAMTFVIRTQGNPLPLATAVREAIWSVNSDQPINSLGTLGDVVADSVAQDRFFTLLLSGFGALGLLLAALGLYGVLAYIVSQQTREIGVRLALGAERGAVLRLVIGRGMILVGMGVVLGLAASLAATRLLAGLVQLVSTGDPLTYVAVTLVLLLSALFAAYLPARRAAAVDPIIALRAE